MEKLLLTPEEAAELLSIGRSKLYQLLSVGALRSVTIGSSRRIPADALRSFVDEVVAGRANVGGNIASGASPSESADDSADAPPRFDAGPFSTARRTA